MNELYSYSEMGSWIEISQSSLLKNIEIFRSISKGQFLLGVVLKGNAYGHGLLQVYSVIHSYVDCIYVIAPQDAFLIRQQEKLHSYEKRRVVVIGAVTHEEAVECSKLDIELVLSSKVEPEMFEKLRKYKKKLNIHIHIDTGLSREGFFSEKIENELEFLKDNLDIVNIKGVMSHFANTEDVTEHDYANFQLSNFKTGYEKLKTYLNLHHPIEKHISASAATLVLPKSWHDSVRVGISLYGLWPSSETRISSKIAIGEVPQLSPVLSWKCKSQLVKHLSKGKYVGYGCMFRAERDMSIAVFPIGYFDGYPRILSGKAHVLIKEKRCQIIGRIMMNHIIVDVTDVWGSESSLEATLIGRSGKEYIHVETLAGWAQTIHYEIVTRIGSHLRRVITE